MVPGESTTEPTVERASRETLTDLAPSDVPASRKESEKGCEQLGIPFKGPASVEIDLCATEAARKLETTQMNQSTNGAEKGTHAPVELIATNKDMKQEAKAADRGSKLSSEESGMVQASKSGRIRHVIALLALSSILMANMNRQAYNQALSRMARSQIKLSDKASKTNASVPLVEISTTSVVIDYDLVREPDVIETQNPTRDSNLTIAQDQDEDETFDWTASEISDLQASFSYGYTLFMIPGGRMSEMYGAKWVIFISSFGTALFSLLTPFLARLNYRLLMGSRVLMGLCQTGVSPALYALYSRWLPPEEASLYLPMIKVGVMLGFTCGSLVNSLPWQPMFYLLGILGFVWSAFWVFFASSMPSEHRFISKSERSYIENRLELHSKSSDSKDKHKEQSKSAPWLRILKNPVVLAFSFTKFTVKLSTETQSQQIPMYLKKVFQVSDQLNATLNGANFAIQAIFTGIIAYLAKEMVVREQFGLRKTGNRRLFQAINSFGMGLAYLLISLNMGSLELVCCAFILLSITSMFGAGGEAVLPIDLTTEYSASIMAIANSAANVSGIILPKAVRYFLADDLTSSENWNHVWWFVSATLACGGLIFTCLVKAKIQGFNEGKKVKKAAVSDLNGANPWRGVEMSSKATMSHL